MRCLACGSEAVVPGTIIDNGSGGSPTFKMDEVSKWKSLFGLGTRSVRGYACVHCSHLQLSVDFKEKDIAKFRQFEGEQPDILERLSSENEGGQ